MFTKAFFLDMLERAISTFAQTLLGAGTVLDFTDSRTYIAAGVAAGLSVLKCLAATRVGAPDSGSLLPASEDPPQGGDAGHGELVQILVIAAGIVLGLLIFSLLHIHITPP